MAQNQTNITLLSTWTELTNSDATAISFQAREGDIEVRKGNALPADNDRGWFYNEGRGERNLALSDLAAGAGSRVFARAAGIYSSASVLVDHA